MLKSNGTGNYTEYNNGKIPATPAQNGFWYAQSLIDNSNIQLANNQHMNLPIGNITPNPATNIRVALTGVYFHRDDNNYYYTPSNKSSSSLNNTYGVNKNSELNVFVQQDTPSVAYGGIACGLGNCWSTCTTPWIKLTGIWINTSATSGATPDQMGRTINHEIGHVLGLAHTFDGSSNCAVHQSKCSDTPSHANAWVNGSNNVMDNNAYQNAITPCQLAIMQNALDVYYRNFFACCSGYPLTAPVYVRSQVSGYQKVILNGSWRTNKPESDYQIEINKTDTYGSQNNSGEYYSKTFSGQYDLIDLTELYKFVPGNFYKIKLTVNGGNCNTNDSEEAWLKIENSTNFILEHYRVLIERLKKRKERKEKADQKNRKSKK
ncbi:MAG TPA: M43 family zinc metalloprotease [Cytophagaceae bacterium]|nr:M43 family zinc metalloprotease [Cytophagaceae bacterium]